MICKLIYKILGNLLTNIQQFKLTALYALGFSANLGLSAPVKVTGSREVL